MKVGRNAALAGIALAAVLLAAPAATAPPPRPNIIIILADDLGSGGLGVLGDQEARTPNIDALMRAGTRLTNGYANHPVCSPSRAALMTGRYPHRFGFEHNSGSPARTSPKFGIPLDEPVIAERLKAQGYATGMFGKWHVGFRPELQPTARGFDAFYGHLNGAHAYTPQGMSERRQRSSILRGTEPAPMPDHLTQTLGAEAVRFIDSNRGGPFFVYLPFNAVHSPMDTTPAYEARFAQVADPTHRKHLAMLAALDDAVGEVVGAVRRNGLQNRTLIVFASDNGGPTQETTSSNAPLSGVKGTMREGGIRVPYSLTWPGVVPAGRTFAGVASGFDITATALAAAGAPATGPALDGVDLTPYLRGQRKGDPHAELFWRSGQAGAVRSGKWKMVLRGQNTALYDLSRDPAEANDLMLKEPAQAARLAERFRLWSAQMQPPRWIRNEGPDDDG